MMSQGERVELRHPNATRPWQHVLDCLCGYMTLAERQFENPEVFSGEWNFGPDESDVKPVSAVVDAFASRWGVDDPWTGDSKDYAHEEPVLRLDSRKSNEQLGWRPILPIGAALEWVADWYQDHFEGSNARDLCQRQIRQYQSLLS